MLMVVGGGGGGSDGDVSYDGGDLLYALWLF